MSTIEELAKLFAEFPGIGERQAKRFVYFLLHRGTRYITVLEKALSLLKNQVTQCTSCFVYFQSDGNSQCSLCRNPEVNTARLMVIEKDADYETILHSRTFDGRLFVLGGTAPVVDKDIEKRIRIKELEKTVSERIAKDGLQELILAFSMTPHGDHTDLYLRGKLRPLIEEKKLHVTSLGRGLSTGTEIEYSDTETLKNALANRQ